MTLGFVPLTLEVTKPEVVVASGSGCEWTTVGEVPTSPGVYLFTVEDGDALHVVYAGLTEHLWMVTKGRLPLGGARPGQRYGRPVYAGVTRERINIAVAEQLRAGRTVRHWVRPLMDAPEDRVLLRRRLVQEEAALIRRWNLRQMGWNRA